MRVALYVVISIIICILVNWVFEVHRSSEYHWVFILYIYKLSRLTKYNFQPKKLLILAYHKIVKTYLFLIMLSNFLSHPEKPIIFIDIDVKHDLGEKWAAKSLSFLWRKITHSYQNRFWYLIEFRNLFDVVRVTRTCRWITKIKLD